MRLEQESRHPGKQIRVTTHFGTKIFGTTVLLLTRRADAYSGAGRESGGFAGRRIPGESCYPGSVYCIDTGSHQELLDISVFIDKVPPGCFHSSEAPNVTQTHGCSSRHAYSGGSNEPEDGRHGARQRRSDHGEWRRTSSADAVEERWSSGSPDTVEEWRSTRTTDALEVVKPL